MLQIKLTPKDNIQDVVNNLTQPATIYLGKGIYRQKTEIRANGVTIVGESRETTVITYDDYATKLDENGVEYNTFRTYTLCVTGEGVRLENLTVENSNLSPEKVGQCVALSVNAKTFSAKNVDLRSTQDTLFIYPFPDDLVTRYRGFIPRRQLYAEGNALHLFENCRIYGTVDFIFGGAEAYFKNCEIVSLKDARGTGYIAAPCHPLAQKYGFYFIDCALRSEGAEKGSVYLARPWRDYGKCAFINCSAESHINPLLFDKWNDTERDKSARFSYHGLKCENAVTPAEWARELIKEEGEEIIARCKKQFKS